MKEKLQVCSPADNAEQSLNLSVWQQTRDSNLYLTEAGTRKMELALEPSFRSLCA